MSAKLKLTAKNSLQFVALCSLLIPHRVQPAVVVNSDVMNNI